VSGVRRLHQISDNELKRAPVADHTLDDRWSPDVVGYAIKAQTHPVEHAEPHCIREAAPRPKRDVDPAAGEAPLSLAFFASLAFSKQMR
jgi:hypothetical protein